AAVKLLRTLSERVADPERVMNIYHEVLVQIPLDERSKIPPTEMRYVLEKYNDWISFYEFKPELKRATFDFFEKHIRELATRAHLISKNYEKLRDKTLANKKRSENAIPSQNLYLERARN